jgi:hypothetical protein
VDLECHAGQRRDLDLASSEHLADVAGFENDHEYLLRKSLYD